MASSAASSVDRNEIRPEHFQGWIDWAKSQHVGMDFNPTFFSHPKAADGFTLAHADQGIREFWIEHGIALPPDRRGDRQGARLAVRHQRLDSRRLQGPADRPQRPARAARRSRSTRSSPRSSIRSTISTRSRASCSASARRATSSARTSSTSATPITQQDAALPRRGPLSSDRNDRDKLSAVLHVARRNPAAREPRRPLGQRPRRRPHRRAAKRSRRNWCAATT